jgi:hypothetical protein
LNEQNFQETELRKLLVEMRDRGFDLMKEQVDYQTLSDNEKAINKAAANATFVVMRLSRQI